MVDCIANTPGDKPSAPSLKFSFNMEAAAHNTTVLRNFQFDVESFIHSQESSSNPSASLAPYSPTTPTGHPFAITLPMALITPSQSLTTSHKYKDYTKHLNRETINLPGAPSTRRYWSTS
eukprot:5167734-Ditylum_brightwellii.AAC.3